MRQDRRPYFIKQCFTRYAAFYAKQYLEPGFDKLGPGLDVTRPWDIELWGPNIEAGAYVHIRAALGHMIRLSTWDNGDRQGRITLGDYVLLSPGTQIISSIGVTVGSNTMIASGCYLSDSDWHDTYDRTAEHDKFAPIVLEENVWLGYRTIVGKGVTIGKNSIIGAGSVVVTDIPANCVAAGNPAKVIKTLDPHRPIRTRADLFAEPEKLAADMDNLDRYLRRENTIFGWLRSILQPSTRD